MTKQAEEIQELRKGNEELEVSIASVRKELISVRNKWHLAIGTEEKYPEAICARCKSENGRASVESLCMAVDTPRTTSLD